MRFRVRPRVVHSYPPLTKQVGGVRYDILHKNNVSRANSGTMFVRTETTTDSVETRERCGWEFLDSFYAKTSPSRGEIQIVP